MNIIPLQNELKCVERAELPALRSTLTQLGVLIGELDCELRYVWIENLPQHLAAAGVIGRRPDQVLPDFEAAPIVHAVKQVLASGEPVSTQMRFARYGTWRYYNFTALPLKNEQDQIDGVVTIAFDSVRGTVD